MTKYVTFRIEVNLARKGADPAWHYLMEDDYSPCEFTTEAKARAVMETENRDDMRLVGFAQSGVGAVI